MINLLDKAASRGNKDMPEYIHTSSEDSEATMSMFYLLLCLATPRGEYANVTACNSGLHWAYQYKFPYKHDGLYMAY